MLYLVNLFFIKLVRKGLIFIVVGFIFINWDVSVVVLDLLKGLSILLILMRDFCIVLCMNFGENVFLNLNYFWKGILEIFWVVFNGIDKFCCFNKFFILFICLYI